MSFNPEPPMIVNLSLIALILTISVPIRKSAYFSVTVKLIKVCCLDIISWQSIISILKRIDGDYCDNTKFYRTDQVTECELGCNGPGACKSTKLYSAALRTNVRCNNHNSCPNAGIKYPYTFWRYTCTSLHIVLIHKRNILQAYQITFTVLHLQTASVFMECIKWRKLLSNMH